MSDNSQMAPVMSPLQLLSRPQRRGAARTGANSSTDPGASADSDQGNGFGGGFAGALKAAQDTARQNASTKVASAGGTGRRNAKKASVKAQESTGKGRANSTDDTATVHEADAQTSTKDAAPQEEPKSSLDAAASSDTPNQDAQTAAQTSGCATAVTTANVDAADSTSKGSTAAGVAGSAEAEVGVATGTAAAQAGAAKPAPAEPSRTEADQAETGRAAKEVNTAELNAKLAAVKRAAATAENPGQAGEATDAGTPDSPPSDGPEVVGKAGTAMAKAGKDMKASSPTAQTLETMGENQTSDGGYTAASPAAVVVGGPTMPANPVERVEQAKVPAYPVTTVEGSQRSTAPQGTPTAVASNASPLTRDGAVAAQTAQETPGSQQQELLDQVVLGLQGKLDARNGRAEIQLNPPSLGAVRVSVTLTNGNLTAQFDTQNEVVRQLLTSQIDRLRTVLQGQGITVDRLAVRNVETAQPVAANLPGTADAKSTAAMNPDGRGSGQAGQNPRQDARSKPGSGGFAAVWREKERPIDLVA